jgi:hypothetical protein
MATNEDARRLLTTVIPHLVHGESGLIYYEFWVKEWSKDPDFPNLLANKARSLLESSDTQLVCSALQAIAVVGDSSDFANVKAYTENADDNIAKNARACILHIRHRMKTLEDLLDEVNDWRSFVVFVDELANERSRAAEFESSDPDNPAYMVNGALGWNNGDIQGFLWAALSYFPHDMADDDPLASPSWKHFAEMLYEGKVTE